MKSVEAATPVLLCFDGEVLTIRCEKQLLAMPAEGDPWPASYLLMAEQLRRLPIRLMSREIRVAVEPNTWTGDAHALSIERHYFGPVVEVDVEKGFVVEPRSLP